MLRRSCTDWRWVSCDGLDSTELDMCVEAQFGAFSDSDWARDTDLSALNCGCADAIEPPIERAKGMNTQDETSRAEMERPIVSPTRESGSSQMLAERFTKIQLEAWQRQGGGGHIFQCQREQGARERKGQRHQRQGTRTQAQDKAQCGKLRTRCFAMLNTHFENSAHVVEETVATATGPTAGG